MKKAEQFTMFLLNDYDGRLNMKMYICNVTWMEMRFLKDLKSLLSSIIKEDFINYQITKRPQV